MQLYKKTLVNESVTSERVTLRYNFFNVLTKGHSKPKYYTVLIQNISN